MSIHDLAEEKKELIDFFENHIIFNIKASVDSHYEEMVIGIIRVVIDNLHDMVIRRSKHVSDLT